MLFFVMFLYCSFIKSLYFRFFGNNGYIFYFRMCGIIVEFFNSNEMWGKLQLCENCSFFSRWGGSKYNVMFWLIIEYFFMCMRKYEVFVKDFWLNFFRWNLISIMFFVYELYVILFDECEWEINVKVFGFIWLVLC